MMKQNLESGRARAQANTSKGGKHKAVSSPTNDSAAEFLKGNCASIWSTMFVSVSSTKSLLQAACPPSVALAPSTSSTTMASSRMKSLAVAISQRMYRTKRVLMETSTVAPQMKVKKKLGKVLIQKRSSTSISKRFARSSSSKIV